MKPIYNIDITGPQLQSLIISAIKGREDFNFFDELLYNKAKNDNDILALILEKPIRFLTLAIEHKKIHWVELLLNQEKVINHYLSIMANSLTKNESNKYFPKELLDLISVDNKIKEIIGNFVIKLAKSNKEVFREFINDSMIVSHHDPQLSKLIDNKFINGSNKMPGSFALLYMLNNNLNELEKLNVIDWKTLDNDKRNISHYIFTYPLETMAYIVKKSNEFELFTDMDKTQQTGISTFSRVDIKEEKMRNKLMHIIDNNLIPWQEHLSVFGDIIKKALKLFEGSTVDKDMYKEILIKLLKNEASKSDKIKGLMKGAMISRKNNPESYHEISSLYLYTTLNNEIENKPITKSIKI